MAASTSERTEERRKQVMIGSLPEDFLRVSRLNSQQQISADEQAAILLQQQMVSGFSSTNAVARLQVTVAEATLVKNYGMTRMDPYVRVRVGHMVYETNTDHNGAKNPRWNKVIACYLPQGINVLTVEVFDERAFTMDEKIAWCHVSIPDRVLNENETHEDWYPLSGKQGEEKEGSIQLILSCSPVMQQQTPMYQPYVVVQSPMYNPSVPFYPMNQVVYPQQQQQVAQRPPAPQQVQPKPIEEADLKQVSEMFPDVEMQVVRSIMEANNGNKDATVNALLSMAT